MARWLITGCSTGIGREIARAALEAGHSVVVTARRVESIADFADEFGDQHDQALDHRVVRIETDLSQALRYSRPAIPPVHVLGKAVDLIEAQAERLADVTHGAA